MYKQAISSETQIKDARGKKAKGDGRKNIGPKI